MASMIQSTTNTWEIISHMTIGQRDCFAVVHPDNELLVVEGLSDHGVTNEIARIVRCACK